MWLGCFAIITRERQALTVFGSPKTEIGGNMGCFARFIDTEGNLQGIWAAK
jgi:predicted enzyme related to lactoylglutathione lyase